ncbi:phage portal protein [Peptoanaerobacter stomatis]|uniref:phage portal protein n=1 Tax=Peptoanaerobacter stomatis TaxID=796937 RepID=UPI001A98A27C|nr:phage portal protein [Peptoanaerobacter stomatis]
MSFTDTFRQSNYLGKSKHLKKGVDNLGIWQNFKKKLVEQELRDMSFEELLLRANLGADYITSDKAMQISAVAMGVNLLASTVSMIPIKLYTEDKEHRVVEVDDARANLLNDDTGDIYTGFELKSAMIRDYILNGEFNIYINKIKNEIKSLHYVHSSRVSINYGIDSIFKKYDIFVDGKKYRDFDFIRALRNSDDGYRGKGIVDENNQILSVAYNTLLYENKQAKTGGTKKGFLQSDTRLEEPALTQLKEDWQKMYGGTNSTGTIILNNGVKFQEATETSQEMQLNERKLTNANEISKILNIPINLLEGKYSDDAYLNTIKIAVSPLLEVISRSLNKYLLLEKEKDTYFFAFDDKELLKGDTLKRYQAYNLALKAGFMQIDEVRYQENLPNIGFEYIKLGLDSVLYNPKTKEIYTPNTDKTSDLKSTSNIKKGSDKKGENKNIDFKQ